MHLRRKIFGRIDSWNKKIRMRVISKRDLINVKCDPFGFGTSKFYF